MAKSEPCFYVTVAESYGSNSRVTDERRKSRVVVLPQVRERGRGSADLRRLIRGHLSCLRHAAGVTGRPRHGLAGGHRKFVSFWEFSAGKPAPRLCLPARIPECLFLTPECPRNDDRTVGAAQRPSRSSVAPKSPLNASSRNG